MNQKKLPAIRLVLYKLFIAKIFRLKTIPAGMPSDIPAGIPNFFF